MKTITRNLPLTERLLAMSTAIPGPLDTPCWLWMGSLDEGGYGKGSFRRADGSWGTRAAHVVSYEHHIGPVPDGLVVDHLCRRPACVAPNHLEAVTQKTNINRGRRFQSEKTHCKWGHAFDATNTKRVLLRSGNLGRVCRACRRGRAASTHVHVTG